MLYALDMGEGAPSLASTATGHENNKAMARNRWRNIARHFILCRVQIAAVCSGLKKCKLQPSGNAQQNCSKIVRKSLKKHNCLKG